MQCMAHRIAHPYNCTILATTDCALESSVQRADSFLLRHKSVSNQLN